MSDTNSTGTGISTGVVVTLGVVVALGVGVYFLSRSSPVGGHGGLDEHRERERRRDPEGFARRVHQSWNESPAFLRTPGGLAAAWDVSHSTAQRYVERYGLR